MTCPVNSTSSPASTRCFCPENHFGSMTRNHTRANCVACPANAVSAPGSAHSSACQCAAGFYGQFPCVCMRGDVWVPLMCAFARSVFFRGVQYQGCAQETPRLAASAVGQTPLPQQAEHRRNCSALACATSTPCASSHPLLRPPGRGRPTSLEPTHHG